MSELILQSKLDNLLNMYNNDPQKFKHWVLPKKDGYFRIVDKSEMNKVLKKTKTERAAKTWVITKELEENS